MRLTTDGGNDMLYKSSCVCLSNVRLDKGVSAEIACNNSEVVVATSRSLFRSCNVYTNLLEGPVGLTIRVLEGGYLNTLLPHKGHTLPWTQNTTVSQIAQL